MFTFPQILLVNLFLWGMTFIGFSVQFFVYGATVFYGFVVGLIMGDPVMGLTVGGTLALMGLGVGGWGGSSVPDYTLGAVTGTIFAIGTGQGLETGIAIGIPIAALGTQFDVISKMSGSFFIHKQMKMSEELKFEKMGFWVHGWNVFRATLYTLPVLLAMTAGSGLIETLLASLPQWLMTGFGVAAGMLPAVGFAILLKYMPVKRYGVYLILGFVLTSYLQLPMLATSLLAFIVAYITYQNLEKESVVSYSGGLEDE